MCCILPGASRLWSVSESSEGAVERRAGLTWEGPERRSEEITINKYHIYVGFIRIECVSSWLARAEGSKDRHPTGRNGKENRPEGRPGQLIRLRPDAHAAMDAEPVDERDAMMDSLDPVEEIIGPMEGVGQGAPSLPPPPGRSPPLLVPAPPPPLVAPGSPPRSEHSPNEPPHARLSSSPYGPRRAGDLSFSLLLQRRSAEGKAEALPRFNLAAKGPEEGEPALQKSTQLPEFLPSTMVEMEPLSGLKWAEDDAVKQCAKCAVAFGYFLRKHHCRACGQIFCYRCSNCSFVLDHELGKFPEPHSNWWHSGGAMFRGRPPSPSSPPSPLLPPVPLTAPQERLPSVSAWTATSVSRAAASCSRWCRSSPSWA